MKRCERCLGMGIKGYWRKLFNGMRVWKIGPCRGCSGTGTDRREEGQR